MSELTLAKLEEMMRSLPPAPKNDLFPLFPMRPMFAGRYLYDMPEPQPRLEVRDIKLKDGTPLLPREFRAKINLLLLERFGTVDLLDRGQAYLLGSWGIMVDRRISRILQMGP